MSDPLAPSLSPHTVRLLRLIHSPPTPAHADAATSLLSTLLKNSSPAILWLCIGHLTSFLYSPSSQTRESASKSLSSLSLLIPPAELKTFFDSPYASSSPLSFSLFTTTPSNPTPLAGAPLLLSGSDYTPYLEAYVNSAATPAARLNLQRIILKQRLGLNLGADEKEAVTYDEENSYIDDQDFLPPTSPPLNKKQKTQPQPLQPSALSKMLVRAERNHSIDPDTCSPVTLLYSDLLSSLLSPLYTRRHGALLALSSLLRSPLSPPPSVDLTARLLAVLVLERFGDYSVTPTVFVNRELAAMILAYIYRSTVNEASSAKLWVTLNDLSTHAAMDVTHGCLLCFKYTVLVAPPERITPAFLAHLTATLENTLPDTASADESATGSHDHIAGCILNTLQALYTNAPTRDIIASHLFTTLPVTTLVNRVTNLSPLSHALPSLLTLLTHLPPVPLTPPITATLLSFVEDSDRVVREPGVQLLEYYVRGADVNGMLALVVACHMNWYPVPKLLEVCVGMVDAAMEDAVVASLEVVRASSATVERVVDTVRILKGALKVFPDVTARAIAYCVAQGGGDRVCRWLIMRVHCGMGGSESNYDVLLAGAYSTAPAAYTDSAAFSRFVKGAMPAPSATLAPPPVPPTLLSVRIAALHCTALWMHGLVGGSAVSAYVRPVVMAMLNETVPAYGRIVDDAVSHIVARGGKVSSMVVAKVVGAGMEGNVNARRIVRMQGWPKMVVERVAHTLHALHTSQTLLSRSSQAGLFQTLTLLSLVTDAPTLTCVDALMSAIPLIAAVATEYPEDAARGCAVQCLRMLASQASARATVDCVLSTLLNALKSNSDLHRSRGVVLLGEMVQGMGVNVKEYVVALLPVVMGLMGDALDEVGKGAARVFARLVRVAPLVEEGEGLDGVIEHLIRGKKLPRVRVGERVKRGMKGVLLRKYQEEGVTWLNFLMSVNLNGVLSDEMGLGKTLQSLIAVAMRHDGWENGEEANNTKAVSLIVCPSTLVNHWVNEVQKFFTEDVFRPIGYSGSAKERKAIRSNMAGCNIVITSFAVLRNDTDFLTNSLSYLCAVLDEGHLLKNPSTVTAKAARRIRAKHKLILSGTPVQNRVQELWAAFDFLMPSFLGSEREFQKEYAKVIGESLREGEEKLLVGEARRKLKQLHQQVLPFILRREKKDVLDELPDKIVSDMVCELSGVQRRMYKAFIARKEELVGTGDSNAFKALLYLRLLCVHPDLVKGKGGEDEDEEDLGLGGGGKIEDSGKLMALKELLGSSGVAGTDGAGIMAADNDASVVYVNAAFEEKEIEKEDKQTAVEGEEEEKAEEQDVQELADAANSKVVRKDGKANKIIVFAQHTRSLDVVEKYLLEPFFPNLKYLRLDGSVAPGLRVGIATKFNDDEDVKLMLLTTKVGGLGLNLTGANIVIFLENDYNPVNDLQAMDRAHRIGQKESVMVYRLLVKGTVEEKIMKMQRSKIAMADSIVTSDNSTMFAMGTDRLLDLFVWDGGEEDEGGKEEEGGVVDVMNDLWNEEEGGEGGSEYAELNVEAFKKTLGGVVEEGGS